MLAEFVGTFVLLLMGLGTCAPDVVGPRGSGRQTVPGRPGDSLALVDGRLTLNLAERATARAGMATKLQRTALADIDAATLPVLLLLKGDKACVLLGRERNSNRVLLPETGQGTVLLDDAELAARATGLVLYVRPHFRFDKRTEATSETIQGHWFWSTLLAQRFVYKDILWAAALINLFALAFPLFSMNVYDRVVPNAAFETLWALAIGVLLILGSDLLMRKLRSRFVDEASARIDVKISATLMERVLGMRLENRPESGAVVCRLGERSIALGVAAAGKVLVGAGERADSTV